METADATTRQGRPRERRPLDPAVPVLLRVVARGVVGGFVATAVMTLYRLPIFRALPPTAEFWARYVGGGTADQYPIQGLVLHVCYGAAAGAVFGPIFAALDARTTVDREWLAVASGLVYGLALSLIGTRIVFRYVLEEGLAEDEALVFHVGHAIYGLTLGTWFGSRERFGDVYE